MEMRGIIDYSPSFFGAKMRKRTSRQESADYFRGLINNSQVAITVVDKNGNLTLFSQGAEKLTGYPAKEVLGKSISMFYPDEKALQGMQETLLKKGKLENYETEILTKDGPKVPILISLSLLKDRDGNPSGSIGVCTDMTKMKQASESFHHLECLYADTIANIDEAIFIMDTDLNILDATDKVSELSRGRLKRTDLIGKNLRDLFPLVLGKKLAKKYCKVIETGKPVRTTEAVEFEGQKLYYDARRLPIKDKSGNITKLIGVFKDITEAKRMQEEMLARNRELSVLNDVAAAVNRSLKLDEVLGAALDKSMKILGKCQAGLFLYDEESQRLKMAASRRIPSSVLDDESQFSPEDCLCGQAFRKGELLDVKGYAKDNRFKGTEKESDRVIIVPIPYHDRILGVMFFYPNRGYEPTEAELRLLTAIAHQIGVAIENAYLYKKLEDSYLETIKALAFALDAKDPYTRDHSEKVRQWSLLIAEKLGLGKDQVRDINFASLLHDVGKLGTSELVLNKPGELTDEEYEEVRQHPHAGSELLASIPILKHARKIVLHHHEFFGGGGYPKGLKANKIPLGARIIAIADAFEAMTADRPYREAMNIEAAKKRLRALAGSQFDPEVVEVFLSLLADEEAAGA